MPRAAGITVARYLRNSGPTRFLSAETPRLAAAVALVHEQPYQGRVDAPDKSDNLDIPAAEVVVAMLQGTTQRLIR